LFFKPQHVLLPVQVSSRDKDFRYMAASDLQAELSKSTFKADVDMQKKLTKAVLQQLEDASGDISSLAVKWWDWLRC
jgi:cullin-associated NEDD8-dissociated protein 1